MKFLMYTEGSDNQYAFRLLSDTGTTLLQSSEFPDRDACVATMRTLIQTLPNANAYSIGAQGSFSVRNTEGVVLANSPVYANRDEAQAAIDFLSDDAADERQYAVELRTTTTQTVAGNTPPVLPSLSAIDFTSLYDFGVASPSSRVGLYPYQKAEDSLHYFCYYDNGEVLLYGRGFDSGFRRDKRIRQVIAAAPKEQRWEIVQEGNEYYFILKEKNGLEIARSRRFGSRADASAKMSLMQGALPSLAAQYPEPEKRKKGNQYDFTLRSATEKGFANLRSADKGYYFILNNDSNQPVLFSQNYSGSGARMGGVRSVVKSLTDEQYIERHEKGGKHYFLVRATNKQEIAHSAFFDSKEEMERSIGWLRRSSSAWVTEYGVDMTPKEVKTKTVTETENFTLDVERPKPTIAPEAAVLAVAALVATPEVETPKVEEAKAVVEEPKVEEVKAIVKPVDVEDDYLICSEYEGRNINDKKNNVAMFKHDNGLYYFAIFDADGKVLLRSEGFTSAQNRDKELSGALKNLYNPDMYSVLRKGEYYIQVLKDKDGKEVGRSCLSKEAPKPIVAPVAAVAAAAIAVVPKAEPKPEPKVVVPPPPPKVEVATPIVEKIAPVVERAAAPVVAEAAAGGSSKWILGLLGAAAIGGLAWWFMNREKAPEVVTPPTTNVEVPAPATPPPAETKVTEPTPQAAPTPQVTPPPAPTGCPACTSSDDPIFTSECNNPKKLPRLGSNPEFGNSHALSPAEFYEKLKKAHETNDVDKVFLDRVYKGMGYKSFADAKPEQFSAVILSVGTSGKLGYSKAHKTGCYTLPDKEYDRKAFRIEAANGCTFHFMKTCGNHFFFCEK
jgi:uncharacterized protein YegP (UPF0339 family)